MAWRVSRMFCLVLDLLGVAQPRVALVQILFWKFHRHRGSRWTRTSLKWSEWVLGWNEVDGNVGDGLVRIQGHSHRARDMRVCLSETEYPGYGL